ncbi:Condensation domain-containing protein [Micromonospora rifamycinica]|uniref:Condensation domain-containing protein n=1 Tax=Micromonospora rifamycinica TaxID=291594 RepID=A0A1C5KFT5_9ACTN|nr:Condensation domain-containing protein [Micromonospora rifamycinica]
MILQAAVAILLSRHGAGTDVVLGTAVAGRGDEALEDLVGLFVNTVVLRTDLGGGPSIRALLDRIRRVDLNCFHHQEVPFEKLVEVLNPARSANRHPLFQVMLMLQNAAEARPQFADLRAEVASIDVRAAKFDLSFAFKEIESGTVGIDGDIEYATEMFDAGTVADLAAALTVLLERMCDDPDQSATRSTCCRRPIAVASWRSSTPPRARRRRGCSTRSRRPPPRTPMRWRSSVVTTCSPTPNWTAASRRWPMTSPTVARPGTTVGILLDRGNDLVATLLAVLRVGATYLPWIRAIRATASTTCSPTPVQSRSSPTGPSSLGRAEATIAPTGWCSMTRSWLPLAPTHPQRPSTCEPPSPLMSSTLPGPPADRRASSCPGKAWTTCCVQCPKGFR